MEKHMAHIAWKLYHIKITFLLVTLSQLLPILSKAQLCFTDNITVMVKYFAQNWPDNQF